LIRFKVLSKKRERSHRMLPFNSRVTLTTSVWLEWRHPVAALAVLYWAIPTLVIWTPSSHTLSSRGWYFWVFTRSR